MNEIEELEEKQRKCKHENVVHRESEVLPGGYYECLTCNEMSTVKEYFE